jgi:hypothetical protein
MWLLDANMDVHLAPVLIGFNISCDTAGTRGWKALSNGDLVSAAVGAGFRCLLTRTNSSANPLPVVNVPQQPWPKYREQFLALWTTQPIEPIAGQLIQWP